MHKLRSKLEELYNSFDFERAVQNDPIKFPKRYSEPPDIEISAFVASSFAYGSIKCFCGFLEELFKILGNHPYQFVLDFKPSWLIKKMTVKYRFSSIHDIVAMLFILQRMLKKADSLEKFFYGENQLDRLENFVKEALSVDLTAVYGKNIKTRGLLHFFPSPQKRSPCKRINLFLRWMVRAQDIDFGLWKTIKPSELIIPLDVHILRVSKRLKLTNKNTQSIKTAQEITEFLKKINPSDPLKYDFILCHGDINRLI